MKKIILNLIAVFIFAGAYAQTDSIASVSIIPASPTNTDNIRVVVRAFLRGGPCELFSVPSKTQTDSIITFSNMIYCLESTTGGCTSTDTLDLGQLAAGTYTVRAQMMTPDNASLCSAGVNSPSLRDIAWNTFTVTTGGTTGISAASQLNVTVSPNPVTDHVHFSFEHKDAAEITLHDISGKLVRSAVFTQGETMTFDVANLPSNVYFYTIKAGAHSLTGKFLIQ